MFKILHYDEIVPILEITDKRSQNSKSALAYKFLNQ